MKKGSIRATEIRRCRQAIYEHFIHAKRLKVEHVDADTSVAVPAEFLEAVGIWLDKALAAAKFMGDDKFPEGEVDHAYRVARAWSAGSDQPSGSDNNSVGVVSSQLSVPRKPKGREGLR